MLIKNDKKKFINLKNSNNKILLNKNKFNNFNNFNKIFVYVKFYKYLNSIKKITNIYCEKYNKLKKETNLNRKKKVFLKKNIIFFFKNYIEGGILKIFN
jgi:hypothetical protein